MVRRVLLSLGVAGLGSAVHAADVVVTSGTTVVNSAVDLGGNNVVVDDAANLKATLQVNSGAMLGNGITLNNGGALVNAGTISRSGPGVSGDLGSVSNQSGGSIASSGDNGIYFSYGGTVVNAAGAGISGTTGVYGDWLSLLDKLSVTNSGTITGTSAAGVDMENGGTLTNQAGGRITGATSGVIQWGGSLTNTGAGSAITGTSDAGVVLADTTTLINTNSATIAGYEGVQSFAGSTVTNSGGATISGHQSAVYDDGGGTGTVINTGVGSTITSDWVGVYLNSGGTVRNENGATIVSTGVAGGSGAAVYLYSGGTVVNGAGSFITGNSSIGYYGIYGSGGSSTITNAGTITGDVRLSDYFPNYVTLVTGGRINGDLYVNADSGSTLTLDGTGRQLLSRAVSGLITFAGGTLIKQGSGTWVIDTSINAFTMAVDPGRIEIDAGTLQVGNGDGGSTAGRITANVTNNGTLAFDRSDNLTYGGVISGTGNLVKYGAGTLTLTRTNTYSGGTVIAAGTLQIGNGGTGGAIGGDVVNEGTLAFNRSNAFTFGGAISGSGALVKSGNGALTLTGNNSFIGGTTINAGTLQIGNGGAAGSITGNIANNAALTFNRSGALTVGGVISGSGEVIQAGPGSTTLSGVNTYTGGTTISAGTLIGSAASFGTGVIQNNATLVLDQDTDAIFANTLMGSGTLVKQGTGELKFTGAATTASTTIAGGRLAIDGSLAQSLVTVESGGILGGHGTVGGIVAQSGGAVAPGNSIGTLHVNGNYTPLAGSIYQAEFSGSGPSDLIAATGTATIANGALLQPVRYDTTPLIAGTRYTVLTALGGVSGHYTLVDNALSAFLGMSAGYDATNVYLEIVQGRAFASAASTPNQVAVAAALDRMTSGSGLYNTMAALPTDAAARTAFDALSGDVHPSIATMLIDDSRFPRMAALDRLRAAAGGVAASKAPVAMANGDAYLSAAPNANGLAFWSQGFGAWDTWSSDGNAAGFGRNIGGAFIGADAPVFGTSRLGAFTGFGTTRFSAAARGASGSGDDYHVGIYGGSAFGNLAFRSGVAYTQHYLTTARSVAFPGFLDTTRANYGANTAQAFGELAYGFRAGGLAFEPFAGLAYVNQRSDGFAERGGLAALTNAPERMDTTFGTIGLRAETDLDLRIGRMTLRGSAGWRHAFGDVLPVATSVLAGSNPFEVYGIPLGQDVALLDGGLDLRLAPNAVLGLSWNGQVGDGLSAQSVQMKFSVGL